MYIQNRILHYRIAPRRGLVKIDIKHDDKCSLCGEETLEHLVYKCIHADLFWLDVQKWINALVFDNYILDARTIILGVTHYDYLGN